MEIRFAGRKAWVAAAVAIAVIDQVLWENKAPGSAMALIYIALWAGLCPQKINFAPPAVVRGFTLAAGAVLLSLLIQPGFLNVTIAVISLFCYRLLLEGVPGSWLRLGKRVLLWGLCGWIVEWFFFIFLPERPTADGPFAKSRFKSLALWVIPLLMTLVFIGFLCEGNVIFAKYCRQVLSWIRLPEIGQIVFWVFCLVMLAPLFSLRFYGNLFAKEDASYQPPVEKELPPWCFFFESMYRGLFLFNAVFLINNIIDIEFLWSNCALPEGITFAAYAHRSAYPLIVTALLAGILVMIAFRDSAQLKKYKFIKHLIVFWLAQNVFLVFSSMRRLKSYVDAYSLTEWRVAAWVWMLLVILGLGLLMLRIGRDWSNRKFVAANGLMLLTVLLMFSMVSTRYLIAEYNLAHCREVTGKTENAALDINYLDSLGYAAYPALLQADKLGLVRAQGSTLEYRIAQFTVQSVNWRSWSLEKYFIDRKIREVEP